MEVWKEIASQKVNSSLARSTSTIQEFQLAVAELSQKPVEQMSDSSSSRFALSLMNRSLFCLGFFVGELDLAFLGLFDNFIEVRANNLG